MLDYYRILEIPKDADQETIAKAYRSKALRYHPDVNSDSEAVSEFKKAAEAYSVLTDPVKKAQYDRNLGGNFESEMEFTFNPEEIFSRVFHNPPWQRQGRDRGRDARAEVTLTFEEAIKGCSKELKVKIEEKCKCERGYSVWNKCSVCDGAGEVIINSAPWVLKSTCSTCGGGGKIPGEKCNECKGRGFLLPKEETILIEVPAGVDQGFQLRILGKGQPGITGNRGTLYVQVNVQSHPFFIRKGPDIYCTVPVNYTQLVLGDTIDVPTINGRSTIKIPPHTSVDKKLRLKGLGAIDVKSKRHGDMYIQFDLEVPVLLDREYENAINNLKLLENNHVSDKMMKFKKLLELL